MTLRCSEQIAIAVSEARAKAFEEAATWVLRDSINRGHAHDNFRARAAAERAAGGDKPSPGHQEASEPERSPATLPGGYWGLWTGADWPDIDGGRGGA